MSNELVKAMMMNRELNPIINQGTSVTRRLMARVRTAAFTQFRNGIKQPLRRIVYDTMYEALLKGMMVGHMLGNRRAELLLPSSLKLSLYDDMLKALSAKRKLNLKSIRKVYEVQAFNLVTGLGKKIDTELQDTVDELLRQGAHVGEAVDTLKTKFDKLGVSVSSSSSIETLFRTQLQTAYNAARWKFDQDPDVQEILWGYKYVTVGDDRVRPEHAELEGVTLPKDDPFWLRFWPPNGWNCRCQAIPIFEQRKVVKAPNGVAPDPGFEFNAGLVLGFDPNQPRNPDGTWGDGTGGVRVLSAAQQKAVSFYTGSGASLVNRHLRNPSSSTPEDAAEAEETADLVAAAIYKEPPLKEGTVLYRGLGAHNLISDDETINSLEGKTINDPAFVSTSESESVADSFANKFVRPVVMRITIGNGVKGMTLNDRGINGEKETILQRATKFTVTKVQETQFSKRNKRGKMESRVGHIIDVKASPQ